MKRQNSNLTGPKVARVSRGVTLVELLVVVAILSVIFAVMIPRLRAVSEDRNIREAARVVASAFSRASSRAVNDGIAGLMIVPNPNFQQATFDNFGVDGFDQPFFAGTRIFQMRRLPPYIGDEENALAWRAEQEDMQMDSGPDIPAVVIDRPFEHDEEAGRFVIQANDEISFNGSSYRYRIIEVRRNIEDQFKLDLALDPNCPAPSPNLGQSRDEGHDPRDRGVPFVVHRQPRRLESSVVELPEGYIIDLRHSGPLLFGSTPEEDMLFASYGCPLNQNQAPSGGGGGGAGGEPRPIVLHFDANGGVSRMFFADEQVFSSSVITDGIGTLGTIQPTGALQWLVTEFDPNAFGADGNYATPTDQPIFNPINKWVTVDYLTGGVNVASAAVPQTPTDLRDAIIQSRAIANDRQSASQ